MYCHHKLVFPLAQRNHFQSLARAAVYEKDFYLTVAITEIHFPEINLDCLNDFIL